MRHTTNANTIKHRLGRLTPSSTLVLSTLALAASVAYAGNGHYEHDDDGLPAACSKTTRLAFKACRNDVRDDYYLQLGKCQNESENDQRSSCVKEARTALEEGRQLCGEQREARFEICDSIGEAAYDPQINPADFLNPEQAAANPNPWFPLVPGMTRIYKAGEETITVTVTEDTREILGVTTIAVSDLVAIDGVSVEDTIDWYAQDIYGNVWYFGEIAQNFEDGILTDLDGSWTAGVDNAKPGILMKAAPQVGDIYRQEFLLGEAEDMAEVLDVNGSESAPGASCTGDCVVTRDFLPLEPDAVEYKYFAPGIGNIVTIDVDTGDREELVEFIQP